MVRKPKVGREGEKILLYLCVKMWLPTRLAQMGLQSISMHGAAAPPFINNPGSELKEVETVICLVNTKGRENGGEQSSLPFAVDKDRNNKTTDIPLFDMCDERSSDREAK